MSIQTNGKLLFLLTSYLWVKFSLWNILISLLSIKAFLYINVDSVKKE